MRQTKLIKHFSTNLTYILLSLQTVISCLVEFNQLIEIENECTFELFYFAHANNSTNS